MAKAQAKPKAKPQADQPPPPAINATPVITTPPVFQDGEGKPGLHKKHHGSQHKTTITGINLTAGDHVVVVGTLGKCFTIWYGTIALKAGKYVCENLNVIREQKDKLDPGRGTEDVSTTVTNPMAGTSAPVTTPSVPIIP